MKRLSLVLLLTVFIGPVAVSQDFQLLDSALAQVGLASKDVRFDQDEMAGWGGDRWRLSFFTMFHHDPFKLPKYGELTLAACSTDVGKIVNLVGSAGRRIDCPVRRGLIGDQLEKYTSHKDSIPKSAIATNRGILAGKEYTRIRTAIDILYQITEDDEFFLIQSIEKYNKPKVRQHLFDYFVRDSGKYNDLVEEMADNVDFSRLVAGVEDLSELVRRLCDSLEFSSFPPTRIELPTRKGLIVIGTAKDESYDYVVPPLLIVDGGGNDTYRIAGYPSGYPFSAIVDVAGDDKYLSADSLTPGLGGAVLGVSIVVDKAGNDLYESRNIAQGCGLFGAGILLDLKGNDTYRARRFAQGSGVFGIGILSDSTGVDSYYCYDQSQGYGYTKGCGVLIDYEGDDSYKAEDSIIFSASAQTPEHNSSLAQGVGFGKRADYIDGHSWAGGVGILCDVHGNDTYSAGLFAQGCAYWYSVGMLLDGSGNDKYNGVWYVQGSGAHFGVGYLDDFAGDDTYNATMNMAVGAGHDFTIGYFNERAGNDSYSVPNLSLGGGNANGIGIFHDWLGDDSYKTKGGTTLGRANGEKLGIRKYLNTTGIFLDGGGNDTYDQPYAGNGKRWIGPASDTTVANPHEVGVGIDR